MNIEKKEPSYAMRASKFSNWISSTFNKNSSTWWLSQLLNTSYFNEFSPLTGTELGFLVSVDTDNLSNFTISAQPGSNCKSQQLVEILSKKDSEANAIANSINKLGNGDGPIRGEWQIALGASIDLSSEDFRVYIGTLDPTRNKHLVSALKLVGLFYSNISNLAVEIIDRIRTCGTFIGLSKRFGLDGGYLLYFAANLPLTKDVLYYVSEPSGYGSIRQLLEFFSNTLDEIIIPSNNYGWGLCIDQNGEFVYLKLEVSGMPKVALSVTNQFKNHSPLFKDLENHCGLKMLVRASSCTVNNRASKITCYFSFTSNPDALRLVNRQTTFLNSIIPVEMPRDDSIPSISTTNTRDISNGIKKALNYIISNQNRDGSWSDFNIPEMGMSTGWVTAHVGLSLAALSSSWTSLIERSIQNAIKYLESRWPYVCAYNEKSPIDADTLSQVILLFKQVRGRIPRNSLGILRKFQQNDGGFSTFQLDDLNLVNTWCSSHPDVTGMAVRALLSSDNTSEDSIAIEKAFEYMMNAKLENNRWESFWWNLDWYSLVTWTNACRVMKKTIPEYKWSETSSEMSNCKSCLDKALLLEYSLMTGKTELSIQISNNLLRNQLANGLWTTSPILRIPRPDALPNGNIHNYVLYPDINGLYSAATIALALDHNYSTKI